MKKNKFSYFLFAAIFFYLTGCEGSDSSRKSTEKKDARNQAATTQKKDGWKAGSPAKGKKGFRKGNNKKKTNVRLKEIEPGSLKIQTTYVGSLLPNQRVLMRSQIDGVCLLYTSDAADE